MKPEDLKAKSERIRDEAKALAATISTAALEETTRAILDVALRKKLVEDISKITENLARRAYKKEEEIRDYASLNEGKEVWVRFFPRAAEGADYDAVLLLAKIAQHTAADLDKRSPSVHVRYDSFVTLIEDLKQEILEGKHDDKLRIKPARAIYDLLRSRLTAEDSGR